MNGFQDRAVLVVGGLGFIGGRLSSALVDAGARVTIVTPSRKRHHDAALELEARGVRVIDGDDRDVNGRGMLTIIEAVRRESPQARVVFAGSRLEYGRVGSDPVAETHETDPLCVHAVHKLVAEQYLRLYERLYGISYAVARITNPFGPGQPRSRTAYGVVNRLIYLALAGEPLPIY